MDANTIHALFIRQAQKMPDQIAVVAGTQKLTYRELDVRSNQLAYLLKKRGVGSNTIVGVMLRRSVDIVVAMLGILKAGGAYLPIDPDYPVDRIEYILNDSNMRLMLTQDEYLDSNFPGEKVNIADESAFCDVAQDVTADVDARGLAYLIYTSGSTGRPKGVMIEHKSVCNLIRGMTSIIDFSPGKTLLSLAPISFDMSVFEIWVPLVNGVTVILGTEREQQSVTALKTLLATNDVQMVMMTPSRLQMLKNMGELPILANTTEIMAGGEAFPPALLSALTANTRARIYNLYGPTETTVWSAAKELTNDSEITIGRPIANTYIYILNEDNNPEPVGSIGELCIGGEGLARGYWQRPELTSEKFVPNPFRSGERMYRTGDYARWRQDGEIEYLGRADHQVKVRGYRIELGEIEAVLGQYPNIQEVVVTARENYDGDKYLCAYYVSSKVQDSVLLRQYLGRQLPDYMIPSYFVELPKIPLTANGKIDRTALPEPKVPTDYTDGYEAPKSNTERVIVGIWEKLLKTQLISRNDNFFFLGGHSLTAMYFLASFHKETKIELTFKELFANPVVKQLAAYADSKKHKPVSRIQKVPEKVFYPVSAAQKRFYFLNQLSSGSSVYNVPMAVKIVGRLEKEVFDTILRQLMQRHEILRTTFTLEDNEVVQHIHSKGDIALEYLDLAHDASDLYIALENFIRPFEFDKYPLVRMILVKIAADTYIWLTDMHHVITDGISMQIFHKEFFALYASRVAGLSSDLPQLSIQYKDYVQWQLEQRQQKDIERQSEYWKNIFAAGVPLLDLPLDFQRPATRNYCGEHVNCILDQSLVKKLKKLTHASGTTLYTLLFAGFSILLAKYSGQQDIVIGTATAGRRHSDVKNLIGPFVNTVAIRSYPDGDKAFSCFLAEIKEQILSALENQDFQFEDLVEQLALTRDASRNPVFDVMFLMEEKTSWSLPDMTVATFDIAPSHKVSMMDITLTAEFDAEELELKVQYSTELFERKTIDRLLCHYINILVSIAGNPSVKIADIDILNEAEKQQIICQFNNTACSLQFPATIQEIFEAQAAATPHAPAVVAGKTSLSYLELNQRANRLAIFLRKKGIGPDCFVGIMVKRSPDMLVAILAVLKAGGAYLPLDPDYPAHRIEFMLKDSGAQLLISQTQSFVNLNYPVECVYIDDAEWQCGDGENLLKINQPEDLAYIIYTSGSTGLPKGVMLEHRSVINFIAGMRKAIDFLPGKKILNLTTISFDIFVLETIVPLSTGATVVIATEEEQQSAEKLRDIIIGQQVNIVQMTPSRLQLLKNTGNLACLARLTEILLGGEALPANLAAELAMQTTARIYNMYGPTETTVWSTIKELTSNQDVTIGRPIINTYVYILDCADKLQPVGIPGELCIGGKGLARGYWNREELTADKFVPDPFHPGERMYRTGDLVKWRADGDIEFLGRIDHQVKVRGYRIELGEIEACLIKYPGLKETVVIAKEDPSGDKYICAYFTAAVQPKAEKIRQYLSQRLPEYMMPTYFIQLAKLPLTPNGKIDRKALPEPELYTCQEGVEPQNDKEHLIANMWQEILGVSRVYRHDDFFALGGHSLKAMSFLAKLHKETGIEMPLRQFFANSTVKEVSEYLMAKKIDFDAITVLPKQQYYSLSAVQERMYFLTKYADNGINYNIPFTVSLEGQLNREQFVKVLQQVVNRHEALRTSFIVVNGELVQEVQDSVTVEVAYQDISPDAEEVIKKQLGSFIRPFDFTQAPLMRNKLLKVAENRYLWLADIHHSIADAASILILLKDFAEFYRREFSSPDTVVLPELMVQYKDFAYWQKQRLISGKLTSQRQYWTQVFAEEVPVLELPADYNRPENRSFSGKAVKLTIDFELTERIKALAVATGTTDYMILLAAFKVLLAKYSGQEDLVVGTATSGRIHADIENVVGAFINTLALRSQPLGSKSFIFYLGEIRDIVLAAFDNQEYQFEQLVDDLAIERKAGRNPLFDIMFLLQNNGQVFEDAAGLRISNLVMGAEDHVAQMDLLVEAEEQDGQYVFSLNYSTELFKDKTIEQLSKHFCQLLTEIVARPQAKLSELGLLSIAERKQILEGFNATAEIFATGSTLHQLFEQQVDLRPEATAVIYRGESMSYGELNRRANLLAGFIRKQGVGSNTLVGLMVDRSFFLLVGILGILKAGGAYLPIDPKYPTARIEYLLSDSKTKILLTQRSLAVSADFDGLVVNIEDICTEGQGENQAATNDCRDLAYVIYTSGSTGTPKGVMIEHRSVINLAYSLNQHFHFSNGKKMLSLATAAFDMSVPELILPLIFGMTIVMAEEKELTDIGAFEQLLMHTSVDIIQITPSRLALLYEGNKLDCLRTVKNIVIGAEPFPHVLRDRLCQLESSNIYNIYGPTETTVWSLIKKISQEQPVTLGKPIANTAVYILDKYNAPQPVGLPGELCISGSGLARGYLNRPELTAEKFVPNPFIPGTKMYKTGDLAKWTEEGEVQFIGRIDEQVKIRGYRIELGEVQVCLAKHPAVKAAVVIDKMDHTGFKCLCAYVVTNENITATEFRNYLRQSLPDYMVPSYFIGVESIPLTPNGKVDRRALPEPKSGAESPENYQGPHSKFERDMIGAWQSVLQIDNVGVNDNFFAIGGDSLKAILVAAKLADLGLAIGVADLFKYPTVAGLSARYGVSTTGEFDSGEIACVTATNDGSRIICLAAATETQYAGSTNRPVQRLFCLPYAGASTALYLSWKKYFVPDIELCLVELPGRGTRFSEPLQYDFDKVLKDIYESVEPYMDGVPYTIFGHSLGAVLSYELVFELVTAGYPAPEHLFLAGTMIPDKLQTQQDDISCLSDSELKRLIYRQGGKAGHEGEDADIWQAALPILRADYRLLKSYGERTNRGKQAILPCDITIINGTNEDDELVSSIDEWQRHTRGQCNRAIFTGGHMFIREQAGSVANLVNNTLLKKRKGMGR